MVRRPGRHHNDGRLLTALSQRRQQPALPVRLADSPMLPSPVELVKLQLHRRLLAIQYAGRPGLVFSGGAGSVPGSLVGSAGYGLQWSFAVRSISAPITPMESSPCGPNWSFAISHGNCINGGGKRSNSGGCCACVARRSILQGRSLRSAGANSTASFAGGLFDFPAPNRPVAGLPTRESDRNHRRQIRHGLFRASGIVIIHHRRHHGLSPSVGSNQNAWVTFGKYPWVSFGGRRRAQNSLFGD